MSPAHNLCFSQEEELQRTRGPCLLDPLDSLKIFEEPPGFFEDLYDTCIFMPWVRTQSCDYIYLLEKLENVTFILGSHMPSQKPEDKTPCQKSLLHHLQFHLIHTTPPLPATLQPLRRPLFCSKKPGSHLSQGLALSVPPAQHTLPQTFLQLVPPPYSGLSQISPPQREQDIERGFIVLCRIWENLLLYIQNN